MKGYTSSIKRYSWVVLVSFLLMTLIGVGLVKLSSQAYQVSTIMIVTTDGPGNSFLPTVSAADGLSQAINYASEVTSRQVMSYVYQSDPQIRARGYAPDDLLADITTATSPAAATVAITATATNPSDAVLLANDTAKGFQAYVQAQLQQQLDQQRQSLQDQYNAYQKQSQALETQILSINNTADPRVSVWTTDRADIIHSMDSVQAQLLQLPSTVTANIAVIQLAKSSDVTSSSKGSVIVVVTAFLGLLIGLGAMLILIFMEDRLRSEEQVKEKLGMAYLGGVASDEGIKKSPLQAHGLIMQQFMDITANLQLTGVLPGRWHIPEGAVLLVTSAHEGEGKTTATIALSGILARAGYTVVVVEGNLRKPGTHPALGMNPAGRGLSGLLKGTGKENVDEVVQRSNVPGVWMLAGGAALNDATLLIEQKVPNILKQLRAKVDVVIIDGPSLLSGAEASILATMADGIALVVNARHDKVQELKRVKEILSSLTHTPVGVIMNYLPNRRRNLYFATAYSTSASTEKRLPDHRNAGNVNGNSASNGQKPDMVIAAPVVKTPSPAALEMLPMGEHPRTAYGGMPMEFSATIDAPAIPRNPLSLVPGAIPPGFPQRTESDSTTRLMPPRHKKGE